VKQRRHFYVELCQRFNIPNVDRNTPENVSRQKVTEFLESLRQEEPIFAGNFLSSPNVLNLLFSNERCSIFI